MCVVLHYCPKLVISRPCIFILCTDNAGTVTQSDVMPQNKYKITGDNHSLNIMNVRHEDAGNYTCKKTVKVFTDGSTGIKEDKSTLELIVQG